MTHTRAQALDIISLENTSTHLHDDSGKHGAVGGTHYASGNPKADPTKSSEMNANSNFYKSSKSLLSSNFSKFKSINTFLKEELAEIRHAVEGDIDYHNDRDRSRSPSSNLATEAQSSVVIERQGGLGNRFVLLLLLLWYFFSAFTLYTNKYIVTTRRSDPTLIGTFQMLVTCVCGFLQLKHTVWSRHDHLPLTLHSASHNKYNKYASYLFVLNIFIIGLLRLAFFVLFCLNLV
jgi:hypothetical protein